MSERNFTRNLPSKDVALACLSTTLGHQLPGVSLVQRMAFRDMTVAAPMGSWHWKRTKCRSGASHVYLLTNTDVVRAWRNSRCIQQWCAFASGEAGLLRRFPWTYQDLPPAIYRIDQDV